MIDSVVAIYTALLKSTDSSNFVLRITFSKDMIETVIFVIKVRVDIIESFLDTDKASKKIVKLLLAFSLMWNGEINF